METQGFLREHLLLPQEPFVLCGFAALHWCWYHLPKVLDEWGGGGGEGGDCRGKWLFAGGIRPAAVTFLLIYKIKWPLNVFLQQHSENKYSGDLCGRKEGFTTFISLLLISTILPPWARWQLTVARRPLSSFFQLVQLNNCIGLSCQKRTGWNKICGAREWLWLVRV